MLRRTRWRGVPNMAVTLSQRRRSVSNMVTKTKAQAVRLDRMSIGEISASCRK